MLSLTTVTLLALASSAGALSFWESQFSTSEFAQFRYKDLLTLSIFQHLKKNASFYITPLVLLDHRSGVVRYNALTEFYELRFRVLMWDSELQESIVTYLTTTKGIVHPEVKMLPMEKVRFEWRSRSRPIKKSIAMETEYIAVHHLPRYLTLTFACKKADSCNELHNQVRMEPEVLDSLVMDCFMTAHKSATKTITVTVDNVFKTKTYSKLLTIPPDGNYWYMRAEDFSSLSQETFSNVRATTMRSSEYVEKFDELNIMQLIEDALKQDEIYSSSLTESQWNSVFWDPAYARPDRVVREATNTFRKNASTNRLDVDTTYLRSSDRAKKLFGQENNGFGLKLSGSVVRPPLTGVSLSGSIGLKSSKTNANDYSNASNEQNSLSSRQLNDWLQEENLNVQWEGERFVVKPIRLKRVNQREFRSRRQLVSHNMQLSIFQQVFSLKVIVRASYNETRLPETSKSAAAFPTQFSYCLLSNGGTCPPGFKRSSGHMKALSLDASSPGMIQSSRLGDSAILCHSPGVSGDCSFRGWEPFKGELHLHVCCR